MNLFRATCRDHRVDLRVIGGVTGSLYCPADDSHEQLCAVGWFFEAVTSEQISESVETIRETIAELHGIANRLNAQLVKDRT